MHHHLIVETNGVQVGMFVMMSGVAFVSPTLAAPAQAAPELVSAQYFDHITVVVNDTAAVSKRWADLLGIESPSTFDNAGPAGNLTYHGVHTDAQIMGAAIDCIGLNILEPTDQHPSFWLDHLRDFGTSTFNFGFADNSWQDRDLDDLSSSFARAGCPTEQTGYWENSDDSRGCYHYIGCADTPLGINFDVMTRNNCTSKLSYKEAVKTVPSSFASRSSSVLSCDDIKGFGIVVPNASASVRSFAQAFGQQVPDLGNVGATEYKGKPSTAQALFGQLSLRNNLFMHVYQPVGTSPSWWYDGLQRYGPSVHLVSFGVPNLEDAIATFGKKGYGVLQRGGTSWVFMDTLDKLGAVIEMFGTG